MSILEKQFNLILTNHKQLKMRLKFFTLLCFTLFALNGNAQGLKKLFLPIPKPTEKDFKANPQPKWEWRLGVTLPAFKITGSTRPNATVDALLLTSTGGGISWQKLAFKKDDNEKEGRWKCIFSWSPATILLSGNLTSDHPVDIAYATTLGFFNNLLMIGGGYDLGVVTGRSRFFGVLSIGLNFNN
jgi:hypothetical protein